MWRCSRCAFDATEQRPQSISLWLSMRSMDDVFVSLEHVKGRIESFISFVSLSIVRITNKFTIALVCLFGGTMASSFEGSGPQDKAVLTAHASCLTRLRVERVKD